MTDKSYTDFFNLLQFSIGTIQKMPEAIGDWNVIYDLATQHALLGVFFYGIERLPSNLYPPKNILLKWFAASEQIKIRNQIVNKNVIGLTERLKKDGFSCCLLKGQGNATMYPNPMTRTPGDIDIWVQPTQGKSIKTVIQYVRKSNTNACLAYHHIDGGTFNGTEVEIHYRPSFMNNLIHNKYLQDFFSSQAQLQFTNSIKIDNESIFIPTNEFNRIYQLTHISRHIFHTGIGLRQIIDYYFLLVQGFTVKEKIKEWELLEKFGLYKVATAVMWVLKEMLKMDEKYLLVQPNEKLGRFLLDEIMLSGNFGQYDPRVKHGVSQWEKNLQRLKRDWRLVWYFPSECLWEPVFRWYHFFWRLRHK